MEKASNASPWLQGCVKVAQPYFAVERFNPHKQMLCKRGRGAVRVLQANLSKEGAEAEAKANSCSIQRIVEVIVFLAFRP